MNSRALRCRDVVADGALWLTVVVWLAFLLGLAGRWWWIADLFAAFRVQYAVLFTVAMAVAVSLRRVGVTLAALIGASITGGSILLRIAGGDPAVPVAAAERFHFVTFNKYWRNPDAAGIGRYLESTRADVIALQEVESEAAVAALAQHMPSYAFRYVSADRNRTSVMFSRIPILDSGTIELVPGGASAARIAIDWHGRRVTVVGVHLHWPIGSQNVRLRNAELARIARLPQEIPGPLLIGGDFNVTAWSAAYASVIENHGLSDCARGQALANTWPAQFPPLAIRIDQCLGTREWQTAGISHGPGLGSDHYPSLTTLVLRR